LQPATYQEFSIMKSILVLIGGGDRDPVIFQTALAAAVPLSAHLEFLHVHVSAGIAAQYDEPVQFAIGAGVGEALDHLESKAKTFSQVAADHVRAFCAASRVEMCDGPTGKQDVTASFREEHDTTTERLIEHIRRNDLVVLGRARQTQGLSPDTLEQLIRNCERPLLVAASEPPQTLTGTIMVCWENSENVARAVAAAMPILAHAKRVVLASVATPDDHAGAVQDLAQQLIDKGVSADVQVIPTGEAGLSAALAAAAADCKADLVVMGAYGRSWLREMIFGSATDALINDIDRPILLAH
jgi:nucleotide-binding universal stress UspA family protein